MGLGKMSGKYSVFLKDGNLIDVVSGRIYKASILILDGMIAQVSTNRTEICVDSDLRTIDLQGKWVLPGLIDMHVHIKEAFAPLFVAAGVTSVRNTGGNVVELRKLREASNAAPTPRVFSADRLIDGPPGLWGETSPWNVIIDDPNQARAEVKRQIEAGADFIKVYGWLSKEIMLTVVQEAKKYIKEVSCDLIYSTEMNALDAANIGIKWNEHASGIIQAIYPNWNMKAGEQIWNEINWKDPDVNRIRDVCSQLIEYGVIMCPTMILFDQPYRFPNFWNPVNIVTKKTNENRALIHQWESIAQYADALKRTGIQSPVNKLIAKTYFDLGGTVVAGTDTPAGIWTLPGMALHRELELFVEAGFSEMDAIRAATNIAAKSLNRTDLGVIKEGAIADLCIFNSNPVEDIRNTKDIDLVIKGGKVYSQEEVLQFVPSEEYVKKALEEFISDFNQNATSFNR